MCFQSVVTSKRSHVLSFRCLACYLTTGCTKTNAKTDPLRTSRSMRYLRLRLQVTTKGRDRQAIRSIKEGYAEENGSVCDFNECIFASIRTAQSTERGPKITSHSYTPAMHTQKRICTICYTSTKRDESQAFLAKSRSTSRSPLVSHIPRNEPPSFCMSSQG